MMEGNTYKKYLGPGLLLGIIFSLIATIYGFQNSINDHHAELIESLQRDKVDNKTMQMVIEQQTKVIEMQEKNFDRLYEEIKELRRSTFIPNN